MILRPFDPWKSELCTCPAKLSLNPYTGCPHGCLYCYASSYIPRFSQCRPKVGLLKRLDRELALASPGSLVAMSNSSDPYPPIEKGLELTRGCLRILKERNWRVQIVTKSDLVVRDIDLLAEMKCTVAITVTTLKGSISHRLEPGAPPPERRLSALMSLSKAGVPVSARIDPLIPGINDSEIEDLVFALSGVGVRHITSSSYKARPDNMKRIKLAFPELGDTLDVLFSRGSSNSASRYLPVDVRRGLLERTSESAREAGLTFSTCREGLAYQGSEVGINCDGSHLLPGRIASSR